MSDIVGLHHIGLLVRDMEAALAASRRLGFNVGAPSYPALPPGPDADPEPVGAGNTHADFPRNFIELAALAPAGGLPEDAVVVPLEAPRDRLAGLHAAMRRTVAGLEARLDMFEGAHILMFATDDADATAARVGQAGGVHASQRPLATADGQVLAPMRYLEFAADAPSADGMSPEGRIGAVEERDHALLDAQIGLTHPNGATGLVECVVAVPDLERAEKRYERYLGIAARRAEGERVFELSTGRLTLATADRAAQWYPGESVGSTPRICACTVEVADVAATELFLRRQGVHVGRTGDGRPFVPSDQALGTAIAFRA